MQISRITHNETLAIRQAVLWPQKSVDFCRVEGDESAQHFGAFVEQKLVSVASVFIDGDSARLRKFATLPNYQNQGIGSAMLTHIITELKQSNMQQFWCDARESALGFYQRFGLQVSGTRFYKSDVAYFKMSLVFMSDEHAKYQGNTVLVNDKMQRCQYQLTAPVGQDFHVDFAPQLTPKQMLALGVFGGKYLTDCQAEFPQDWFTDAKLNSTKKDISLNYFSVDASQSLAEWQAKGWIHPQDPRGWFQWYCRYYMGRRTPEEDLRQIKRWRAFSRHAGAVKKFCEPYDFSCRKKQRQALLHWAYDARLL